MEPLLTAGEMRAAESRTVAQGICELILMEHAALALSCAIEERFAGLLGQTRGLILAGPGNNGGDVLAAARQLRLKGAHNQTVFLVCPPESDLAKTQLKILTHLGVSVVEEIPSLNQLDWVLDGIFGIGLSRIVEGKARTCIDALNAATPHPWVVCADIPTGLCANTGRILGVAVRADATVTFGFLKRGLVTGSAGNCIGELRLDPIQIGQAPAAGASLFEMRDVVLPKRQVAGHKGHYGHAKLWCGSYSKQGAALLAAQAALRTGVGLVSVVGLEQDVRPITDRLPAEVMVECWSGTAHADSLGVGPGMGFDGELLRELLMQSVALVLDADALTTIASDRVEFTKLLRLRKSPTVMTPHPKEAARLLSLTDTDFDRFDVAQRLCDEFGCSVLLKGKGTIVSSPGHSPVVVREGDSSLSRGGAGDMLAGLIAGFLAQGLGAQQALLVSAYCQGKAAERCSQELGSQRTVTVSELTDRVSGAINELR